MSVRLYLGDSANILKTLEGESVDLTVTSPPYDELRDYNGYSFDFETISEELFRVTKPGGVVIWVVADMTKNGSETGTSFRQALHFMDIGFLLHDTMIWAKDGFTFPEGNRYPQTFEYMFVFSKGKPKTHNLLRDRPNKWAGETRKSKTYREKNGVLIHRYTGKTMELLENGIRFNVWNIPAEKNNVSGHPAPFPFEIPRDHIRTWSNPGDVVLDPFLGSGTSGLAAYDLGRDFIGIEISEEYFEIAKGRIDELKAQIRMDI